jgi:hypothetical protein
MANMAILVSLYNKIWHTSVFLNSESRVNYFNSQIRSNIVFMLYSYEEHHNKKNKVFPGIKIKQTQLWIALLSQG